MVVRSGPPVLGFFSSLIVMRCIPPEPAIFHLRCSGPWFPTMPPPPPAPSLEDSLSVHVHPHWSVEMWEFPPWSDSQPLCRLSVCSPDEDSCQKFVPFIGVRASGQPRPAQVLITALIYAPLSSCRLSKLELWSKASRHQVVFLWQHQTARGASCGRVGAFFMIMRRWGLSFEFPEIPVDSDDAMGGNASILSSPTPPSAGPYGKEIGGTPPQSPSVSTALSGAGYDGTQPPPI